MTSLFEAESDALFAKVRPEDEDVALQSFRMLAEELGIWLLTRWEDVNHAFRDLKSFINTGATSLEKDSTEKLPFPNAHFDCVSIAFGLRNVTRKEAALCEMYRVLRPGGIAVVLEFSKVWSPLAPAYDWYSFNVLPRLGRLVAGDEASYRYLAESIRMHPDQDTLKKMMEAAGLSRVEYFNLTAGVVAVHKGVKI